MVDHAYRVLDADRELWSYVMTYQTGPRMKLPDGTPTPFSVMLRLLTDEIRDGHVRDVDPGLATEMVLGMIMKPADGVVYEELPGPLSPHAKSVAEAIERVLAP